MKKKIYNSAASTRDKCNCDREPRRSHSRRLFVESGSELQMLAQLVAATYSLRKIEKRARDEY